MTDPQSKQLLPKILITYTYDPNEQRLTVDWPASNPVIATFIAIWGWEYIRSKIKGESLEESGHITRVPPGFPLS